jgi:hypothetical protein
MGLQRADPITGHWSLVGSPRLAPQIAGTPRLEGAI